jgi:hypothetical protein
MEMRIAKREEANEHAERLQKEKELAASRPPVWAGASEMSEPDTDPIAPSEMLGPSEMDYSEPDFPPGYSGCLPRMRRPASAPQRRLTQQDLVRLQELGRAKPIEYGHQKSAFSQSWGFDNGIMGWNKSVKNYYDQDVTTRVLRGEVKRNRPLDAALGRNIKYANRHSAALLCASPNYGELDPLRIGKENKTANALRPIAARATGSMGAAEKAVSDVSVLGAGGYGPWGGSMPEFLECKDNTLVMVPHRERPN